MIPGALANVTVMCSMRSGSSGGVVEVIRPLRDEQLSSQRPYTWVPRPHNSFLARSDFGSGAVASFVRPEHALCHARHERIIAPPKATLLGRRANREGAEQMQAKSGDEQIEGLHVHAAERKKQRNWRIARVRELGCCVSELYGRRE